MRKVIVLLAIVALGLGVTGATCMQNVQEAVCNPPQSVIDIANAAAPLVASVIVTLVPGSEAYVTAVTVQAAVTAIQGGACVTITQINTLIAWLQSDEAVSMQMKAMAKAGPANAKSLISVQPLIDWRDGVKK